VPRSLAGDDTISRYGLRLPRATVKVNRPRATRQVANQSEGYAGTVRLGHLNPGGLICRDVLRTTRAFSNDLVLSELIWQPEIIRKHSSVRRSEWSKGARQSLKTASQPDRQAGRQAGRQSGAKAYRAFHCEGWPPNLARPTCGERGQGRTEGKSRCRSFT
jgi:hypothetical protein